ncbi:transmembrane protein 238-like [Corythoichthys intestinalis]|uniref:transmembrane protein 238-like n=1 Tax=Corythoichthys intestinalis TaxID=161448 RepID=UPI0025A5788A|nr:transmembrane protein 238-like [Corythoichthys intestinalis]
MNAKAFLGKCVPLIFIALALDLVGLILLLVGVFADVRASDGQFYGDFLIFTGALAIFTSLGFWVFWYAGNVRNAPGVELDGRADGLAARIVRKLSERLSRKMAVTKVADDVRPRDEFAGDSRPHRAGRVTWGKATAYDYYNRDENDNKSYDKKGYDNEKGFDNYGYCNDDVKSNNQEECKHANCKEEGRNNYEVVHF